MSDQLRQYGVAVMPLHKVVDGFCLKQGNMKQANYLKTLVFAKWAWRELFIKSIWEIRTVALAVCAPKNTIKLPDDCERLVNISIVDCHGKLHPLGFNPYFNTTKIKCAVNNCSCQTCHGHDTLCAAIDSISITTLELDIKGTTYIQTTWVRANPDGTIQQATNTPVWDEATDTVKYVDEYKTLCNVEVTTSGCIKSTPGNIELLSDVCGCGNFLNGWDGLGLRSQFIEELVPTNYNYYGQWNWNAGSGDEIEIFGHRKIWGRNGAGTTEIESNIRQVIVAYQTNGEEPGTEILVPEYAVQAIEAGIIYQQAFYNPRDRDKDGSGLAAFRRTKRDVNRYLYPVRMDDIAKMQTNLKRW